MAGDLIWVLRKNGRLYGLEPASGEVVVEGRLPRGASHMAAHDDALWVSCGRDRRVARFDPGRGQLSAEIQLDQPVRCLIAAGGNLLVGCARTLSRSQGWLHAIDCRAERVTATVPLPNQPRAIAVDGETAWVACGRWLDREGTIERVDMGSCKVTEWRATSWAVGSLALIDDILLASMSLELAVPFAGGEIIAGGGGGGECGGGEGGSNSC